MHFQKKLIICFLFLIFNTCFAQQLRLIVPIGHTGAINDARFSPDGKKIITAAEDNTAKLWDAYTGALLADLKGHTKRLLTARFSPDSKKIITVSRDNVAKLWDASTGILLLDLKGHTNEINVAEFSPDGKKIITASFDQTAKIWDATTGDLQATMGHLSSIISAHFSPDGKKIVTGSLDNMAKVWDALTGKLIWNLYGHSDWVKSAEFSSDGKMVVTASRDSTVKVWDTNTGLLLLDIRGKASGAMYAQFSPDGEKIVTAYENGTSKLWNTKTGSLIADLIGHNHYVRSAKFSADGKMIVTASPDNTAKVWDASTGKLLVDFKLHGDLMGDSKLSAEFSADSKRIVTSSDDKTAKIWEASTGKVLVDLRGHVHDLSSADYLTGGNKIITTSFNYPAIIWDVFKGTILCSLGEAVISGQLTVDGKRLLTVSLGGNVKIWDVSTWTPLPGTGERLEAVNDAQFSPDGNLIVIASWDGSIRIAKGTTNVLFSSLYGHRANIHTARFSPDGKKIVTASDDSTAKVWDVATGGLLLNLKGHKKTVHSAEFSPDGKKIMSISMYDSVTKIWDSNTGQLLADIKGEKKYKVTSAQFDFDSKKIVTSYGAPRSFLKDISGDFPAIIWDAISGLPIASLKGHTRSVNSARFSPDGKKIVTASDDNTIKLWDSFNGNLLADLAGHEYAVKSAYFSPDGKNIISASEDYTVKIWDLSSGKIVNSFFALDSNEYFNQVPAGYYQSSMGAAKLLHYVTKDLKVISFEQLDIKYNRPDKVLEAIGNTDTTLISSYRKAYEKRIRKLGIDTNAFRDEYSVPESDFANRRDIAYEIQKETLMLHIRGMDSTYKLDRFNVWVNEAPVFGQRGISLRNKNSNYFDSAITIKLSQGKNNIETSITNVNGTESYRIPLIVNYVPAAQQNERTYFIGIGIDKFSNSKYNLQYSAKDIRDLSKKLKEKSGNDIEIDTLFNENVNLENVKALKKKLLQTTENDKIIIAYSGHGMLSKEYDYYLSTYAVNFDNPLENGLPYDELENLLDSIPARKKLLLIDACHSGEVDKEEMEKLKSFATDSSVAEGAKGVKPLFIPGSKKMGMKNSFELMQQLFVNVGRSTGATVISAAAGTQFALERGDLKNGVFTYSILEFMKDHPAASISRLKEYINKRVPELTRGLQVPTSRTETNIVDWNLW